MRITPDTPEEMKRGCACGTCESVDMLFNGSCRLGTIPKRYLREPINCRPVRQEIVETNTTRDPVLWGPEARWSIGVNVEEAHRLLAERAQRRRDAESAHYADMKARMEAQH